MHDALMVAKIDEAQAAKVTGNVGPAAQGHGLADQGLVDEAAEVGTHENSGRYIRSGRSRKYSAGATHRAAPAIGRRSEEHTSELQSLMRISYAVFCLKKK